VSPRGTEEGKASRLVATGGAVEGALDGDEPHDVRRPAPMATSTTNSRRPRRLIDPILSLRTCDGEQGWDNLYGTDMEQDLLKFMSDVALVVWADVFVPPAPICLCGLPGGRELSFSEGGVNLYAGGANGSDGSAVLDGVTLDSLLYDRDAATKLSEWLGELFAGERGVFDRGRAGWGAWAVRPDGQIVEISVVGYLLYPNREEFELGDRARGALRRHPATRKES
jgi:hypothetical protein